MQWSRQKVLILLYKEVTNVLIAAADFSIPKSSSHSFQHYKPWWNADCQTAYKNQRKLWGIFRRYPTTENLLAFKTAKANARRSKASESRGNPGSDMCPHSLRQRPVNNYGKRLRLLTGYIREFSFPILQTSNSVLSSPVEIANIL
ncbi:RNase H domain-containing protein, partial [Trichonephila clavipes]